MRLANPVTRTRLSGQESRFRGLQTVVDNTFKKLRAEGVGCNSEHTETLSKEEENKLWDSGVLGTSTPQAQLQLRAVFYLNGKDFYLHGQQEHRNLRLSQMQRFHNPDKYVYTENVSKNRSGGIRQLKVENKVVPIFATQAAGTRCHVYILDTYCMARNFRGLKFSRISLD